jgi:hypothetical protein
MLKMSNDINIKGLLQELSGLEKDLKLKRQEIKKLSERQKEIKNKISKFLKENNQPGVRDLSQGIAVISEKKKRQKPKKEDEKRKDAMTILHNYMDESKARQIYDQIKETLKGNHFEENVLKVLKI